MSILGFIFFIIVAVFVIGFSVIANILRALFGQPKRTTSSSQKANPAGSEKKKETSAPQKRKKVFDKDEGEYVDYEEIK